MDQENTKEIQNLKELKEQAIDTLELEIVEDMDEHIKEADAFFEKEVKKEEETKEDNKEEEKTSWKEKMADLKKKWQKLSKKRKIVLISLFIMFFCLIIIGFVFLLNRKENQEIPLIPDVIVDLDNYRYQNGELIFLDEKKEELGKYTCENQEQELCYVAYISNEDKFDEPKYVYEDGKTISKRVPVFLKQYAFVYDNKEKEEGLVTLYDFKNQKKIDSYSLIKNYDKLKDYVILKNKEGKYGLFEITEEDLKPAIDFEYDYLGIIQNNKEEMNRLVAVLNGKWYLIDFENKKLTKPISFAIVDYNAEFLKVIDEDGKYHLLTYENKEITTEGFDYIDLLEQYLFYIKEQKLFITDMNHHKMNIDGIPLLNSKYPVVSVYDQDKKLLRTEKSYEVSFQGSNMNLVLYKENYLDSENFTLNLNEGRISADLAYLNYFDGKLNFYKDSEKKELLGSYTCSNKNSISDDTKSLENCKLAMESYYASNDVEEDYSNRLGVLPIYNERFAFIYDSKSESDSTIILYDLKENVVKAKYKSVDAGAYTNTLEASFASINNMHIIAENKSGQYGIIKMNYNSLEGFKEFEFNHIERIGYDYIIQDSSGYALMNHNGTVLTNTAKNKIRNYNEQYIVRSDGTKYYLYDYKGEKSLTPSGYEYISLHDKYYGIVSNHSLNFCSYEENTPILKEGIALSKTNYFGSGTLAYKAIIRGSVATIQVGESNGTYKEVVVNLKSSIPEQTNEGEQNE